MELVVLMNFFQLYNIFKVSPFPNSSLRNLKCIMITNFFLKFRTFIPIPPNKFFFFGSQNDSSEVVFFFFFFALKLRGDLWIRHRRKNQQKISTWYFYPAYLRWPMHDQYLDEYLPLVHEIRWTIHRKKNKWINQLPKATFGLIFIL